MPFTVLSVLKAAEGYLCERKVDAPRLSAEHLTASVLGLTRLALYLQHDRPLGESERARLRVLVARRGKHEPLAYLLGEAEFGGLTLHVSPAVLIPRPETEQLVVLAAERGPEHARVVDLGTGSGAIAVALAQRRPDLRVVASDTSGEALAIAAKNVARHGLQERVTLMQSDWWAALGAHAPFDLLVCNPPYVDPSRDDLLAADVKAFEPHLAVFSAPRDPASCYRKVVAGIGQHMRGGAWCVFETGVEAAEPALAVLRECASLDDVELRQDLAGLPRYLLGRVRPG